MINTLYLDSNNVIKYHNYIFHFKVVTHTLLLLMG